MHNVEKSAFRKGEYVGYGGGLVWHIRKTTSSSGNWVARPHPDNQRIVSIYAFRLKDMSDKLERLNMVKKNPKRKTAKRKFTVKQIAAQKLFAKRAKAGTLKKKAKRKTAKRKAVRKNPVKRAAPRSVKRKVARRKKPASPRRATKNPMRKKRSTSTQSPRRSTSKWVIRANRPMKSGYKFYYLRGDEFVLDADHATKHSTVKACHDRMRAIQPSLPNAISSISCMKV